MLLLKRFYFLANPKKRNQKHSKWFQRIDQTYAIDGTDPIILNAKAIIESNIPEDYSDNPYAFARRSFEFVQEQVTYGRGLEDKPPRSGPE